LDSNQRGCLAEYLFATECIKKGYNVSMPLLDSSIYDMIVDTGNKLIKIQIKSTTKSPDRENHKSVHIPIQNNKREYFKDQINYFAIWVNFFNGFFIFKNTGNMQSIRLSLNGKNAKFFNNFAFK
jgi:hypothetical protein